MVTDTYYFPNSAIEGPTNWSKRLPNPMLEWPSNILLISLIVVVRVHIQIQAFIWSMITLHENLNWLRSVADRFGNHFVQNPSSLLSISNCPFGFLNICQSLQFYPKLFIGSWSINLMPTESLLCSCPYFIIKIPRPTYSIS